MKHYTQLPSELETSYDARYVHVRGVGFLSRDMVGATLEQWQDQVAMPGQVLVDLREVAGYESGCAELAHEILQTGLRCGVRRIAFVATSAVLRTATRLVASAYGIRVRFFADELAALRWLEREEPRLHAAPLTAALREA